MKQETVVLVDGQFGIYIPQKFVQRHVIDGPWKGVSVEQQTVLLNGPEEEDYWEVWEEVMNNANYEGVLNIADKPAGEGWEQGDTPGQWKRVWRLWQDGDLFAYCGDGDGWV